MLATHGTQLSILAEALQNRFTQVQKLRKKAANKTAGYKPRPQNFFEEVQHPDGKVSFLYVPSDNSQAKK